MKRMCWFVLSFLLVAMFVTTACVQAQETFTVKVTGYSAKGYSISPAMSQQLITQVVAPIQSALKRSPGSEIAISIAGYADKSGTADGNDNWGAARAQGIYNFLVTRVPKEATFGSYSVGSTGLDERAVIISVMITRATPAPAPQQKKGKSEMIASVILFGMIIAVIVARAKRLKAAHSAQPIRLTPAPQVTEAIPATVKPATKEMVRVEKNGKAYDVPIEFKDGAWYTPFPKPADATQVEFRKDHRDAIKAVRTCMADKHDIYSSTIEQLIDNGTIKVVPKGEAS